MNKKWIILWHKNKRIGSIKKTKTNLKQIKRMFIYDIIQKDNTGTIHLNILSLT